MHIFAAYPSRDLIVQDQNQKIVSLYGKIIFNSNAQQIKQWHDELEKKLGNEIFSYVASLQSQDKNLLLLCNMAKLLSDIQGLIVLKMLDIKEMHEDINERQEEQYCIKNFLSQSLYKMLEMNEFLNKYEYVNHVSRSYGNAFTLNLDNTHVNKIHIFNFFESVNKVEAQVIQPRDTVSRHEIMLMAELAKNLPILFSKVTGKITFKYREKKLKFRHHISDALICSIVTTLPALITMGFFMLMQYKRDEKNIENAMKIVANQLFKKSSDQQISAYHFHIHKEDSYIMRFINHWPHIINIMGICLCNFIIRMNKDSKLALYIFGHTAMMLLTSSCFALFSMDKKLFFMIALASVFLNWIIPIIVDRLKEYQATREFENILQLLERSDMEIL